MTTSSICPRCQGHYDSVLHAICEARLQLQERAEGWRLNVRVSPLARPLMKLRRSPTGSGRRLVEEE
jgi:hypothetical protein